MAFTATYSTFGTTVKIHAANCSQALWRPGRLVWDLQAQTLQEASAELEEQEQLSARGWKIAVCKCAKNLQPKR